MRFLKVPPAGAMFIALSGKASLVSNLLRQKLHGSFLQGKNFEKCQLK